MNNVMRNVALISVTALLLFVTCSPEQKTNVVILSCEDEFGNELTEMVEITVDGESKMWAPGDPLLFEIDMDVDQGYTEVFAYSENYRMVSPNEYQVGKGEGIELVLTFTSSEVPEVVENIEPEPEPEQEPEEVPVMVEVRINTNPEDTEVTIRPRNNASEPVSFSGSQTVELLEGAYQWEAELEGFDAKAGMFTVQSEQTNVIGISLTETPPEDGFLSVLIQPSGTDLRLINQETNEELQYEVSGLRRIPLRPGQYRFTATAPGFNSQQSSFIIREEQETDLSISLQNSSAREILSEARDVVTITQAEQFYNTWNGLQQLPQMDTGTRDELFRTASDIAMILYDGGSAAQGQEMMEDLYSQEPDNVELRLRFGAMLMRSEQFVRSRSVLRDILGQLRNLIPVESREAVVFETRFRIADSYYREFLSLNPNDFDARTDTGERALRELQDVVLRFEEHPSIQNQPGLENLSNQAADYYNIVNRELGY